MGTEQQGSGTTGRDQDNVVQLPRDWLGPRDELVPFGPRAADSGAKGHPARSSDEAAFAAEDFWGENSESLHTAVRGPVAESATAPPPQPVAAPPVEAFMTSVKPRIPRTLPAVLAAAATIGAAIIVLVAGHSSGGASPSPSVIAAAATPDALVGHLAATGGILDAGVRRLAAVRPPPVPRHRAPLVRHRARQTASDRPVGTTSPASSSAAIGSGGGQESSSPAPSTASSSSGAGTVAPAASSDSGSSNSRGSSGGSSSNNPPAFGATGALGPGSSPNG